MKTQPESLALQKPTLTREEWLCAIGDRIAREIIAPVAEQFDLPLPPVRYSIGLAIGSKNTIGICCTRFTSATGHNEIFISAQLDEPVRIADVVAHELIHAFLNNEDGHTGRFRTIAKGIGLTGKMTATVAGEELEARLKTFVEELPTLDVGALTLNSGKKKQASRSRPVKCTACGFAFAASRTQLYTLTEKSPCPCCEERGAFMIKWREGDLIPQAD